MTKLKYLAGYPEAVLDQVRASITNKTLGQFLLNKYPETHKIKKIKGRLT